MAGHHSFLLRAIDQGRLLLLNQIAQGSFGEIYTAVGPTDPKELSSLVRSEPPPLERLTRLYAVKRLPLKRGKFHEKEVHAHRIVSHISGVVSLHHVLTEEDGVYLVMDYYPEGDLHTSVMENPHVYRRDSAHVRRLYNQLMDTVQACHDANVYHRDLKPENILMDALGTRLLLADFGISTQQDRSVDFGTGSVEYMSPECLGDLHCTEPFFNSGNDVWGLGMILFFMLFELPPWTTPSTTSVQFNAFLLDPDYFLRHYPVSVELHRLFMAVFTVDPRKRPSLKQLRDLFNLLPSSTPFILNTRAASQERALHLSSLGPTEICSRVGTFSHLFDTGTLLRERSLPSSPKASFGSDGTTMDCDPRSPIEILNLISRPVPMSLCDAGPMSPLARPYQPTEAFKRLIPFYFDGMQLAHDIIDPEVIEPTTSTSSSSGSSSASTPMVVTPQFTLLDELNSEGDPVGIVEVINGFAGLQIVDEFDTVISNADFETFTQSLLNTVPSTSKVGSLQSSP